MHKGIVFLFLIPACFAALSNISLSGSIGQSGLMDILVSAEFEACQGKEVMLNLSGPLDSVVVRDRSGLIIASRLEQAGENTLIYATVPDDFLEYDVSSQSLTSKDGNLWSMEISVGSSEALGMLEGSTSLPQGAVLKSTNGEVQAGDGLLLVKWSAADIDTSHRAVMRLSYVIGETLDEDIDYAPFIIGGLAVLIIVPMAYALLNRREKQPPVAYQPIMPDASPPPANPVLESLDETDKEIVRHIIAAGGKTTQARIYLDTHVPKATLSRRLASLENRGLIIRSQKGNRKLVSLGSALRS